MLFEKISKILKRKSYNDVSESKLKEKRIPIYEKKMEHKENDEFVDQFVDTFYTPNKYLSCNSFFYPKTILEYKKKMQETGLIPSVDNFENDLKNEFDNYDECESNYNMYLDNEHFETIETSKKQEIEDFHYNLYKIHYLNDEQLNEDDEKYVYQIRSPSVYSNE